MQRTLEILIESMELKKQLRFYDALIDEVYKSLQLGNIEMAKVLIEYSLKKGDAYGKEID